MLSPRALPDDFRPGEAALLFGVLLAVLIPLGDRLSLHFSPARVHDDHRASIAACARVGLLRTKRESDDYWAMLGEADPAAGPA